VYTLGDLAQKGGSDLLIGWVLLEVDRNEELLSLLIDIADINTTLVGEEDPITLSDSQRSDRAMHGWRDRRKRSKKSRNTMKRKLSAGWERQTGKEV
jgi:hypothetical protein